MIDIIGGDYRVDNKENRLTIDDRLKLQGFYRKQKQKMLGNTIPTIFPEIIGKQI